MAELRMLRSRLLGGIRNKAARGELRRALPVGFVWGDQDGEVRFHPHEAVRASIHSVLARFAELGSIHRVWVWLGSEGLAFPMQSPSGKYLLGRPHFSRSIMCSQTRCIRQASS